jgi:pilus assembly protein CpaB
MRFDRRFLLVVAMSLGWAALVSGAFYRLARGGSGRAGAVSLKQVVVSTKPLLAGSIVERGSIALRGVPDSLIPPGAFSRLEDVLERPVISDIQADEPVVSSRVAVKGSGSGLGPLIPPGMRAISVRVNDVVGVAGFVLPGMRVDVLVTGKPPNRGDTETQTVLQNITVLSAGQSIQNDTKSQPVVVPVVTLLVTPSGAEALTLANAEGKIQLVLRNSSDRAELATSGRHLHELYSAAPREADVEPVHVEPMRVTPIQVTPRAVAKPSAEPEPKSIPAPEKERMMLIVGKLKTVEVFSAEKDAK